MHRGIVHTYASGTYKKHLVGDRALGKIYQLSMDNLDDAGDAIRRIRRAPHVSNEHKFMVHRSLTIDMETGVGTQTGQGADPKGMLRFSDDGGRTWSNEIQGSLGKVGKTLTRVKFNRLGRSRDRIYEWAISDPVKVTLVDAYLDLLQGTN